MAQWEKACAAKASEFNPVMEGEQALEGCLLTPRHAPWLTYTPRPQQRSKYQTKERALSSFSPSFRMDLGMLSRGQTCSTQWEGAGSAAQG